MREPAPLIPVYTLYGEVSDGTPSGFGHIETIAERSALHDWEIAPHRHRHCLQVLIVAQGEVEVSLDAADARHIGPCYVAVPAGAVHGFRFEPGTRGHVLTLSQEIAHRSEGPADPLTRLLAEGGHGPISPEQARRIALLTSELLVLAPVWTVADGLFRALAEALLRSLPIAAVRDEGGDDRRLALFRHLVETHLAEHRPISFYAASIGTTPRTLTRLVKRRLDCTPLDTINRRMVLEAHRLLRYTNASVAQVAEQLGFADPSYFSRFYLRITGRRPAAERL